MAEKEKSRCILLIGSLQEELQGLGIILGNASPSRYIMPRLLRAKAKS